MPMGNPAAYGAGQRAAAGTLGLGSSASKMPGGVTTPTTAQVPAPPGPKAFQPAGVQASAPAAPRMATKVPGMKSAAFSMSPNPETRAQEALKDNVRQPPTNEDRRIATGIDPAFNYLGSPSESDPYTIPRLF